MRKTKAIWLLPSVVISLMLVLTACGGDDEEATPTARATSAPTATSAPGATTAPTARPTAPPAATAAPGATAAPTAAAPTAAPAATATPVPTAAPTPTPGQAAKRGGVLRVRDIREWAPFWDTWHNFGGFVPFVQNLASNLVRYDFDNNTKIVPDLATEWSTAADGMSYTFKIRQGVTWHDGKPFTAQDVVWNLNRGINPPDANIGFNRTKFASVQSAEAVDASTVKVNMKRPSASFLPSIAAFSVLMYPPHIDMAKWQETPVGTGPFKLSSWERNSRTVLQKNDRYHITDAAGGRLPYLDGMEIFVIAGDPALAYSAFRTGRLDCGCGHDHDFVTINADRIRQEFPGAQVSLVLADQFSLMFNMEKKPFDDVRVREAFSRMLDRRALVLLPRGGQGRFPPHHMPSAEVNGQWGLPDAEILRLPGFGQSYSAEVTEARKLLAAAGVDPKTLNLTFLAILSPNVDPYHIAAHSLLLNNSGANIRLVQEGTTAFNTSLAAKGWDISMTTGGTSYDDPSAIFVDFVSSTGSRNRARLNYGVDDMITQQEAALDFAKRRDIVYEMQRKLIREATLVPSVYQVDGWATHAHVKGWRPPFLSVGPQNRMERVWLDR